MVHGWLTYIVGYGPPSSGTSAKLAIRGVTAVISRSQSGEQGRQRRNGVDLRRQIVVGTLRHVDGQTVERLLRAGEIEVRNPCGARRLHDACGLRAIARVGAAEHRSRRVG